jgi:hypothetical protein
MSTWASFGAVRRLFSTQAQRNVFGESTESGLERWKRRVFSPRSEVCDPLKGAIGSELTTGIDAKFPVIWCTFRFFSQVICGIEPVKW